MSVLPAGVPRIAAELVVDVRTKADGKLELRVEVPAAQASSCDFGESDLDLLFITTAQKEFPVGGKPDQPHAGGLIACRPGVHGLPAHRFAG